MVSSLASRLAIELVPSTLAVTLRCGLLACIGIYGLTVLRKWGTLALWGQVGILGLLQFLCMYLSTAALQYTTVAKMSFFSSLFIFIVPVLRWGFYRARYTWHLWPMLIVAGLGVVAASGGFRLTMNRGDYFAFLASIIMAVFVVRLEKVAREVPATQLAHMLGLSLFGWSLFEFARVGPGRGFSALTSDSMTSLWNYGASADGVWVAVMTPSMAHLAWLGFAMVLCVWVGSAWLASQAQARAQAVLPSHTVSILLVLGVPFTSVMAALAFEEPLLLRDVAAMVALVVAAMLARLVRERTGVVVVSVDVAQEVELPSEVDIMVELEGGLERLTEFDLRAPGHAPCEHEHEGCRYESLEDSSNSEDDL